ncbi:hypothetical protein QQP08_025885 [Theobroma cacao]|nr:hypothetical protein QQP08_025885 [Theobroma cacao]
MGCFCCAGNSSQRSEKPTNKNRNGSDYSSKRNTHHDQTQASSDALKVSPYESVKKEEVAKDDQLSLDVKNLNLNDEVSKDGKASQLAQSFTFAELAAATGNFRSDCFLGEGGFGKVYKGFLEKTNEVVAIKQLDRNGVQGVREKAIDNTRDHGEQNLVAWARPMFRDRRNFSRMVDPLLQGQCPVRGLYQALAIAAMCVQEQPNMRPAISDVVMALNYLASQQYDPSNPVQSSRRSTATLAVTRDDDRGPVADHEPKTY